MSEYYAYVHARSLPVGANGIFYVGKGKGNRAYAFNRAHQNPYYARIVNKNGTPLVGLLKCSSEDIAFELEKGLIKCLRRMGVKLTNLSDGGEGQSGYVHTMKTKLKLSAASSSWTRPESLKKKIAASQLGELNNAKKIEARRKISEKRSGSVWMNNGDEERLSKEFETLRQLGWNNGRLPAIGVKSAEAARGNTNTRNTFWVSKGKLTRRVSYRELPELLANGWNRGRQK